MAPNNDIHSLVSARNNSQMDKVIDKVWTEKCFVPHHSK